MLKKIFLLILSTTMIFTPIFETKTASAQDNTSLSNRYELIVKYKAQASALDLNSKARPNLKKYTATSKASLDSLIKELKNDSTVELVQPDIKYKEASINENTYKTLDVSANDRYLSSQWYIKDLNILKAQQYKTGANVLVGVVDTGIDYNHEDLLGKVVDGVDFTGTGSYMDNEGHGTHVAGTIAANSNNSTGVVGIAPNAKLLAIKALDSNGQGDTLSISQGIIWAADHGAKIINLSLGSDSSDQVLKSAVDYANNKGCIMVAASGNDGNKNICYPAAYDNVLSVGAVDEANQLASFSNFGDKVDFVAPGVNILSTVASPNYRYAYMSGTSMATAVASGQIALLVQNNANLNTALLKTNLKNYTYNNSTSDKSYGAGIMDVTKVLTGQATSLVPKYASTLDDNTYGSSQTVSSTNNLTGKLDLPFDADWYKVNFNNSSQVKIKFTSPNPYNLKAEIFDPSMNSVTTLNNSYFSGTEYTLNKGVNSFYYIKVKDDANSSNSWNVNFTYNAVSSNTSTLGIKYRTHVQNIGWEDYVTNGALSGTTGKSYRLEGINIILNNPLQNMRVKYQTHIQNIGWQAWKYDGQMAGTSGLSLRMEAIKIMLENAPTGYHIEYQAHVQNIGWQNWVRDGALAGTTGKGLRVEAIRIRLVKDGVVIN